MSLCRCNALTGNVKVFALSLNAGGSATVFQLTRSLPLPAGGRYQEPVWAPTGTPVIQRAGTPMVAGTDYTLGAGGRITLTSPGIAGQALTWTGGYALRVRFKDDSLEFERFLQGLWQTGSIDLISKVYE